MTGTPKLPCWRRCATALLSALVLLAAPPGRAQEPTPPLPASAAEASRPPIQAADAAPPNSIVLNHRTIVTFRATLLGRSPTERAAAGSVALQLVLDQGGPGEVTVWLEGGTAGLRVDGHIVFYLVPGDLEGGRTSKLAAAAEAVRAELQVAVAEVQELTDLRRIGKGLAYAAAATLVAFAMVRVVLGLRRFAFARLAALLEAWQPKHESVKLLSTSVQYGLSGLKGATNLFSWALMLLLAEAWVTFVFGQFAYTRPWGERSLQWALSLLGQVFVAAAGAVPGLLTTVVIFFIARQMTRANTALMARAESGEVVWGWLDRDTAGPTRRVGNVVIWLFALAVAYPFLPGASSEAFKGVSVLAGLMLSLGASGVVGQAVSGLSLMYSRTLRPGEFVRIGDTEGTVTVVGMFATKIHTGMNEEVSLPNSVVSSQPVRNYSRLVKEGQFTLHTTVTIGYATPWRQVHAMLIEAARRTPGVAPEPPPYVMQTALSDFYVEYRLCAQGDRSAPRRRAEAISNLHGNVQDVFNEYGVQIMSPHYLADPAQPQVVPPDAWFTAPAKAPSDAKPTAR